MIAIISTLYLISVLIAYFILFICACREYKNLSTSMTFERWYKIDLGDNILFSFTWPVRLIARLIQCLVQGVEKYIKKKFNIE